MGMRRGSHVGALDAVLKIPIARSPEATWLYGRATYSHSWAALVGDLKLPYLSF